MAECRSMGRRSERGRGDAVLTRPECVEALRIAKQLWSYEYADKDREYHEAIIGLWERSFPRESFEHIKEALYELSATTRKHPQIHEIRQVVWKNHGRPVDSDNLRRIYKMVAGEEWTEHTYDDLVTV